MAGAIGGATTLPALTIFVAGDSTVQTYTNSSIHQAGWGQYFGTYFVTADITPLGGTDGMDFCRSLPERCGVVAVPNAEFYADPAAGRHLVRFAFCKRADVLAEAAERLAGLGRQS